MDKDSVQAVVEVAMILVLAHEWVERQCGFESDMSVDLLASEGESLKLDTENVGGIVDGHLLLGIDKGLAPKLYIVNVPYGQNWPSWSSHP